jgi:deazaflavin-dependent oxidoreductase (nitroreductase family)
MMGRFSLPDERPDGLDSPITTKVIKYMARIQVWLFQRTNGRIGNKWRIGAGFKKPVPTLLLEHRGRKSGKLFTTPVLYLAHGDAWVVVASQGGLPKNPQWYYNLRALPETRIHIKGHRDVPVLASVAGPTQRAKLWPLLVDLYADFVKYAAWADREIPVVILTRRATP